ncbi:MAG TPA: hypothetical protein VHR43_01270 [Gemmatimonadales bacterium]|jgi:hypothetical protein|nr:hypothetical protein [Gemmatimonadales bacterium]
MRLEWRRLWPAAWAVALLAAGQNAEAQVQVRLATPGRATYSELHEALKAGSAAADTVARIQRLRNPARLWRIAQSAIGGTGDWNAGLVALTRLAELRDPAYADSARRLRSELDSAEGMPFPQNPGLKAEDVTPSLQAIILERRRATDGDSVVLADILGRLQSKHYDHGDAWVLGRLGAGARDSLVGRFRSAKDEEFRVRYLTLLSYFTDPGLIPFFAGLYAAPDSAGLPKRYAIRASDGLLWIGTRESLQALLEARAAARARHVYDDPSLRHAGLDFLGSDSSSVISRTGKWLTGWIATLRPSKGPAGN